MDVHPPLAKMLIALTGWLAGFDGDFDFKDIGKDYLEPGVPYVAMRLYPALCGIFLIPCIFLTLKAVGCRTFTAAMGAGLIIFGSYRKATYCRSHTFANHLQKTVSLPRLVLSFSTPLSLPPPPSPLSPSTASPTSMSSAPPRLSAPLGGSGCR